MQELTASDYELKMELQKRKAFLFENHYRILDASYLNDILNLISLSVIEYDLDWNALSWNSIKELSLEQDIPQEVLMHSLKVVSQEYFDRDGDIFYKISKEEWGKTIAEYGFVYKEWSGMSQKEFLENWKCEVPEGFQVDLDWMAVFYFTFYLKGHGLYKRRKDSLFSQVHVRTGSETTVLSIVSR